MQSFCPNLVFLINWPDLTIFDYIDGIAFLVIAFKRLGDTKCDDHCTSPLYQFLSIRQVLLVLLHFKDWIILSFIVHNLSVALSMLLVIYI